MKILVITLIGTASLAGCTNFIGDSSSEFVGTSGNGTGGGHPSMPLEASSPIADKPEVGSPSTSGGNVCPSVGTLQTPPCGAATDAGRSEPPRPDAGGVPSDTMGLPCDIQAVLQERCQSCHGNPPVSGAPMPLVTYADLTVHSTAFPMQTIAERALARMNNNAMPMPPPPASRATSAQVAAMSAWVSAGTPAGSCGPVDAGSSVVDAGNPFGTPPVCTSGRTWPFGNLGSPLMHPGQACIACHATNPGPDFAIAGTVYPTAHEPDNCNGSGNSGASVVITDANGNTTTLTVNAAGNFSSQASIAKPYRAKVVVGNRERAMSVAQTSGDCNGCHTQSGASSAPGRILLP